MQLVEGTEDFTGNSPSFVHERRLFFDRSIRNVCLGSVSYQVRSRNGKIVKNCLVL